MFITSLGDISIRSKVESFTFIESTTILIPEMYSNSLYCNFPSKDLVNTFGDVASTTKFVSLSTVSSCTYQPYFGVMIS